MTTIILSLNTVGATRNKKLYISSAKTEWWLMSSGKLNAIGNMHVLVPCQIDVVNKQLVFTHSSNNPLSETSLSESYILIIYRHPNYKEKHSLSVEGVYNK